MGEAKRRGTFEERKAAATPKPVRPKYVPAARGQSVMNVMSALFGLGFAEALRRTNEWQMNESLAQRNLPGQTRGRNCGDC